MPGPKVLWCAEHDREGGTCGCLTCACIELSSALSRIDYMLGPSNEMELSDYDLHVDPQRVVDRLRDLIRPDREPFVFTKDGDFDEMVRDQSSTEVPVWRVRFSCLARVRAETKELAAGFAHKVASAALKAARPVTPELAEVVDIENINMMSAYYCGTDEVEKKE